jgi:putative transposase
MDTKRYPTDLTEAQWQLIEPLVPVKEGQGRPTELDLRRVIDAVLYICRTGCQWRSLPHDFPAWTSVRYYFDKWKADGTLDLFHDALRKRVRQAKRPEGRASASVDSQSTDSHGAREDRAFDGGKKLEGRKRHIIVDSIGLLLGVVVTSGGVADAEGGKRCLGELKPRDYPEVKTFFADRAYDKAGFPEAVAEWRSGCGLNVVARPEGAKGYVKLKYRWVVERTFGWLTRNRRLCRSYEHTTASEVAFIKLAMIGTMTRRLSPSPAQAPFAYRKS